MQYSKPSQEKKLINNVTITICKVDKIKNCLWNTIKENNLEKWYNIKKEWNWNITYQKLLYITSFLVVIFH